MKRKLSWALPVILILFALIVCMVTLSVFYTDTSSPSCSPRNYLEDGTHSDCGNGGTDAMGINAAEGDPSLLTGGHVTNVVIFICFQDEKPSDKLPYSTTSSIMDYMNGEDCSLYDYYRTISYGTFSVTSIAPSQNSVYYVYKAPYNRAYYKKITSESGTARYNPESTLLNGAVTAASNYLSVNRDAIDVNSDGYVDSVSFVVSGSYESTAWGTLMWPHAWNLNKITKLSSTGGTSAEIAGVKVDNYTFTFAEAFRTGLIVHEFGHLVGLPDLYHYDYDTDYLPVGYWDIMHLENGIPQFPLSYTRSKYLGFLGKNQVLELTKGGVYTLSPTSFSSPSDTVAYKITLSATESIWMEYRSNAAASYDCELPMSGLVVYRINSSVSGNTAGRHNKASAPDEVFVYRKDIAPDDITGLRARENSNLSNAALSATSEKMSSIGSKTITSAYSQDCLYLSNGTNTGIVITVTEQNSSEITFNVDLGKYDCTYIGDSYVSGTDLNGATLKNAHHAYYGQPIDIKVYLQYNNRPSPIELTSFELEYTDKVCPEGQVAYVKFYDSEGERKIPFTLYIHDILKLEATVTSRPTKTRLQIGEELSLSGLSIIVDYVSGRTERIFYDQTNPDDWLVIEGFDPNTHGTYDHILMCYHQKIYFTLDGISVNSTLVSIQIDEKNSRRLFGDAFTPSLSVSGVFEDGTVRKLSDDEYTLELPEVTPLDKCMIRVVGKENPSVSKETYGYYTASLNVQSITVVTPQNEVIVPYAKEPSFEGGVISVEFDNGKSIELQMINYSSELLKEYSFRTSGSITLNSGLGYKPGNNGGPSFSVNLTVLPRAGQILSVNADSPYSDSILIDETENSVTLLQPMTLSELNSALSCPLDLTYKDTAEGFEMSLSAFADRKAGKNTTVNSIASNGSVIFSYTVYLLGDSDGDGMVSEEDVDMWLNALLTGNKYALEYDADRDGFFTLNDFVLLLRKTQGGTE